eukprot:TRINITY_DN7475_c0_g2_i3.p1 TRINITY_DN7475_c0_g2~~TRINITY_DN7475_c0_g2_i3.p1  ORF type:complete len:352 (-),score=57.18 TRINITY_DN7475_c0_g2_i3:436-1491(-)
MLGVWTFGLLVVLAAADMAYNDDGYDLANYDGNYAALDGLNYYGGGAYDQEYDEFAYGADYQDPEYGGYGEDDAHYYGDEYSEYYEEYGQYGDQYGDDYFFDDAERQTGDCTEDETGKATLAEPACDVKISGFSSAQIPGGIDGTYRMKGCYQGRPKYKREHSPKNQDRTLWYSAMFSDWDISAGQEPNEATILAYGGDGQEETRPNFVPADRWHLHAADAGSDEVREFKNLKVDILCVDGKALDKPKDDGVYQPLLTQDEAEAKYRAVYTRYGRRDPDPTVNFAMVIFMVLIGVLVVLGIPYMMFRRKDGKGANKSFAQMLEEARKKRAGHTHQRRLSWQCHADGALLRR